MPEQFENLLSGAAAEAGRAARTPGAAAARARGRRLRNQRRVTAAALSLTMLAGAGTAAAVTLGQNHQGAPTVNVTSTVPTGAASPSATPSGPSASPSQTSSTAGTPSGSQSTAQSSTKLPAPGTVVGAAWLSPSQLPFGTGYPSSWQLATDTGGTLLGDSVYREDSVLAGCSEEMPGAALSLALSKGLAGEQYKLFFNQGIQVTSQAIAADASQETLFYSSAGAALTAWNQLTPVLSDQCPPEMTGTDATTGMSLVGSAQRTLNEDDAACWSMVNTPTGGVKNGSTDVMHVCYVRSGSLISLVTVMVNQNDPTPAVSFDSIDPATVSALRQALAAYGSEG